MTYGLIGLYGDWNISGNTADRGGGIYVRGSQANPLTASFTHAGITIADNTAHIEGGGVYLGPYSNIIMQDGSIYGNSALRGGGVHIGNPTSTMDITGGFIGQPGATGGNSALQGGGVFASNGAQLSMSQGGIAPNFTRGQVMNNTGGIYVTGMYGTTSTTLNMSAGIIGGNSLLGQGNGQGVTVVNGAVFNITGENAVISGNVLGVSVTGVSGTNRSTVNMSNGTIGGNSNLGQGNTGGGIRVLNGALFNMTGANAAISGNSAGEGAGVYLGGNSGVHRATAHITAGTIGGDPDLGQANVATADGGGMFINTDGFLHMNGANARITGNSANRGGGIAMRQVGSMPPLSTNYTEILMTAGEISHNTATTDGGGIYMHGEGTDYNVLFNFNGGEVSHNTAGNNGGGITGCCSGDIIMRGTALVYGNTAISGDGGGIRTMTYPGEFIMYGGTFEANTAQSATSNGGGLFINTTATFRGTDAKIFTNNTANGVGSATLHRGGGGVFVSGTMTMEDTSGGLQITNNSAPYGMGGGIFTTNHGNYPNPLPYNAAGRALHYQNLTLRPNTIFSGNTASFVSAPPDNTLPPDFSPMVTLLPNIGFSSVSPVWPSQGRHHPINNYDINYYPEEEGLPFRLHKTGMDIYHENNWFVGGVLNQTWLNQQLRGGAQFVLYAYTGSNSPAAGYVPAPGWVSVDITQTSSTNPTNFMTFALIPGIYYQLVEVVPPQGYQPALGQWRLRSFSREVPIGSGNIEVGIAYSIQGHPSTPRLVNPGNTGTTTVTVGGVTYTVVWGGLFYVGNQTTMELPMSGGIGSMIFTFGGSAVLMLGALGGMLIYVKRRRRVSPRPTL